jgi:peptidyl-prolyl cis-trans isomerase D
MLQDIRQNVQGTAAKIVVGIIVISFSLFGIESILLGGGGNSIAEVNGEEISPQELQQSVDTQKRRLIAMMGNNYDPAMLDDERLAGQALEALIGRKLLMQSARDMKLAVSEGEIGSLVASMDQFKADGVFSPQVYKSVLSSAGYTPGYFKQVLHDDILVNQLRSGLAGSDFATPAELALTAKVVAEQRDLRYVTIPQEKFISAAPVKDEEVATYYTDRQAEFRTFESVDLDYIELSLADFIQPAEERAVLEAFEIAKEGFQFQARNRISHILFEDSGDGAVDERIALAQARLAEGAAFADVARELSDDVGSAAKGGDLGFSDGDAFPEEMESAIAQLQPGTVSAPLETDAGVHLIVVTERSEGKEPSLEEMRPQLEATVQADEARVELVRTVESLRDLVFNAEGLDAPAKELDLSVKSADGITRNHAEGVFANASLLGAAYSEEVLESGHNSEVIELANDTFAVLRVRTHNPPEVKPLELVKEEIVAVIIAKNARAALMAEAENALTQLRSGVGVEEFADAQGYEWQVELGVNRSNSNVLPEVLRRTFELPRPAGGAASADYILTQAGDAVVIKLVSVNAGDYAALQKPEQQQIQQQVSSEFGSLVNTEFDRSLRERAEISTVL